VNDYHKACETCVRDGECITQIKCMVEDCDTVITYERLEEEKEKQKEGA